MLNIQPLNFFSSYVPSAFFFGFALVAVNERRVWLLLTVTFKLFAVTGNELIRVVIAFRNHWRVRDAKYRCRGYNSASKQQIWAGTKYFQFSEWLWTLLLVVIGLKFSLPITQKAVEAQIASSRSTSSILRILWRKILRQKCRGSR